MRDAMLQRLAELRFEPTEKHVRVRHGGQPVAESRRAVLVWEPRRIVPSYAVPIEDLQAELVPAPVAPGSDAPILHPGIAFAAHSTPGEAFHVRVGDHVRDQAAFRPTDAVLSEHVILDFRAFDEWFEEAERIISHPRDPFHRVDVRTSSRHVRIELDGELLAESTRAMLLFETGLPTRFYLPHEDIRAAMTPSERRTSCAYKGEASYWSFGDRRNLAWTYQDPLPDAVQIKGRVAFFDELVDVTVDGNRRARPRTRVTRAMVEEVGAGS